MASYDVFFTHPMPSYWHLTKTSHRGVQELLWISLKMKTTDEARDALYRRRIHNANMGQLFLDYVAKIDVYCVETERLLSSFLNCERHSTVALIRNRHRSSDKPIKIVSSCGWCETLGIS